MNMRVVLGFVLVLPLCADITHNAGGMNPLSARVVRDLKVAAGVGWSNWDLSFDGATIGVTSGKDVVWYDTWTGRERARVEHAGDSIHDTGISGDGDHYALTLDGGRVDIYSAKQAKKVGSFPVNGGFC